MTLIPQRTVASQLAQHLRGEIARGAWRGWLPSERSLSARLQASRNSLRTALRQLEAEGLVEPSRGRGHRVLAARPAPETPPGPRTVGLLLPEPIGRVRPLVALWIDELREMLPAHGCHLRVHTGRHYYGAQPARALERLVAQEAHAAWILTLSAEPLQQWFALAGVPALVAGSVFGDLDLPFVDADNRASCRHAAGTLLRHGHRRVALLLRRERRPGDAESERGFLEGMGRSRHAGVIAEVASCGDEPDSVASALDRLLRGRRPPSALIVCNPYIYLTVQSLLARRRLRVPEDISLISRDDDPFLPFVVPQPARYAISPHSFACKLLHHVLQLLEHRAVAPRQNRLLLKFVPGASISPPPRT